MLCMANWLKSIWHRFTHRLGINTGRVVTWRDEENIYVGFQCDGCGEIDKKSIEQIHSNEIFKERESNNEF